MLTSAEINLRMFAGGCAAALAIAAVPGSGRSQGTEGPARALLVQPAYTVTDLASGDLGYNVSRRLVLSAVLGPSPHVNGFQLPIFWVAEEVQSTGVLGHIRLGGGSTRYHFEVTHRWIDGRNCLALGHAVKRLVDIRLTLEIPGAIQQPITLMAPPSWQEDKVYGMGSEPNSQITWHEIGYDNSIAQWWRATDSALAKCWTNFAPTINGEQIAPQIQSPTDAPVGSQPP